MNQLYNAPNLFVSDIVKKEDVHNGEFNLVLSGCGTGKSHWVSNELCDWYNDIDPSDMLVVTSRALTRDQQANNNNVIKFNYQALRYWNGELDLQALSDMGMRICCYSEFINGISSGVAEGRKVIERLKIIIFDECHILFSDEFIDDIKWLRVWIANNVETKLIFGLTATPNIIDYYNDKHQWGVKINCMNKTPFTKYKAKHLICTSFDDIPSLINTFSGKTIILCPSIKDCNKLKEKIKNSCVLVSQHSSKFTKEMSKLRDYILKHESLPSVFVDEQNNTEHQLKVLLCTSTAREGFNLKEESEVKNVICCCTDELHVVQFAGRCRYNIDNLVVAKTHIRSDNMHPDNYVVQSRQEFNDYSDGGSNKWFYDIEHIVEHDENETQFFFSRKDINGFLNYINEQWLMPTDTPRSKKYQYYIIEESQKNQIIDSALDHKIFDLPQHRITFNRVIRFLKEAGYDVVDKNSTVDGKRQRYKVIVNKPDCLSRIL